MNAVSNVNGIYSSDSKNDLELAGFISSLVDSELKKFEDESKACIAAAKAKNVTDMNYHLNQMKWHVRLMESRGALYAKVVPSIKYVARAMQHDLNYIREAAMVLAFDQ